MSMGYEVYKPTKYDELLMKIFIMVVLLWNRSRESEWSPTLYLKEY